MMTTAAASTAAGDGPQGRPCELTADAVDVFWGGVWEDGCYVC